MSLSVAVAVFLVVALCIADGVGRDRVKAGGSLGFYAPKVVFGVLTLAVMLLLDITTFPSLIGWDRGSLLAVQNWPEAERETFAWVASARVFMVGLWAVWMLCRIYISGCLLRKLPYVPNRYQQLSYSSHRVAAFLLGVVYVMFALWRLIEILEDDLGGNTVAAEFMLFIKTRQDHLGSGSILSAYALQLLLLFLPSSFKESKLFRDIAVRFVYFEEQIPLAKKRWREGGVATAGAADECAASVFRGASGGFTPGDTPRMSSGDTGKEDEEDRPLFCVETAAWLLELAWEAYNDPAGFVNPNNYHFGLADFARIGFELVEHIHNVEHDTHCFILKDVPRGTEFNMDQMMPKGREHEAPKVLREDIDIQAAESLHGVVAHLASASEEVKEGGYCYPLVRPYDGTLLSHASFSLPPSLGHQEDEENEEREGGHDNPGRSDQAEGDRPWNPAFSASREEGGGKPASEAAADAAPSPALTEAMAAAAEANFEGLDHLGSPRIIRSHSMTLVSDIEEGKGKGRWPNLFAGGRDRLSLGGGGKPRYGSIVGLGAGGLGHKRRGRSASFDQAAKWPSRPKSSPPLGRINGGVSSRRKHRRMSMDLSLYPDPFVSPRHIRGTSPGVMEGLGRGFVRRKEDLVRGTEAGIDLAREAARRGLEAADNAAHVMGINRIPVLRQYLWGQVHTGFWNSYEAVRGQVHASVRKTVVDWLLSQDNPPDIKLYVTGHSMGGALATHCAMDLKLHTIDKIQARLGNFVRVRRTLMQKVIGSLPRRRYYRRVQPQRQHPHRRDEAGGGAPPMGGRTRDKRSGDNGKGHGRAGEGARHRETDPQTPNPPLPPPPPPPPVAPSASTEKRDGKAATAAPGEAGAELPPGGGAGGAKSHSTFHGLASNFGKRFQKTPTGASSLSPAVAANADRKEGDGGGGQDRGNDCASAFSLSSGKGSSGGEVGGGGGGGVSDGDKPVRGLATGAAAAAAASTVVEEGRTPHPASAPTTPGGGTGGGDEAGGDVTDTTGAAETKAALPPPTPSSDASSGTAPAVLAPADRTGEVDVSPADDDQERDENAAHTAAAAAAAAPASGPAGSSSTKVLRRVATHLTTVASALDPRNLMSSPSMLLRPYWGGGGGGGAEGEEEDDEEEEVSRGKVELHMFSFGAPRVGNPIYAARYNDVVPHSFRVVVDGDPVPGVPSWWYTHVGTKVLIDGRGRGSLIMDPSFVEKRFFVRSKRYVLSHLTEAYQAGLRGNLLQAVPPRFANSLPAHWPFGIKAESDPSSEEDAADKSSSSDDDDDDDDDQENEDDVLGSLREERWGGAREAGGRADEDAEEADRVTGGPLPSASMVSKAVDDMAQHAVDALNEADHLNRGQSFRLDPGWGSSMPSRGSAASGTPSATRGTDRASTGPTAAATPAASLSGGGAAVRQSAATAVGNGGDGRGGSSGGRAHGRGVLKRLFRLGGSKRGVDETSSTAEFDGGGGGRGGEGGERREVGASPARDTSAFAWDAAAEAAAARRSAGPTMP
ncbi:unnamed protein product [Scytosiphon promiscuus]